MPQNTKNFFFLNIGENRNRDSGERQTNRERERICAFFFFSFFFFSFLFFFLSFFSSTMDSQCKLCNLSKGEKRWPCSWRSSPGCVSQSVVASSSIMVGRHWLFATNGCWSCWLLACWLACFAPSIVTSPAEPDLWEESGFYTCLFSG